MVVDQPGLRRVPTDLYEWNERKRRRYELLTMVLLCAVFAAFVAICLTVGASPRH